jgi:hypothetical protein
VQGLGDTAAEDRIEKDRISAMTFDKEGGFLSVGDHDGRVVIFTYVEPSLEMRMENVNPDIRQTPEDLESKYPKLEFFEEIFAFDPEFNFQKCVDV